MTTGEMDLVGSENQPTGEVALEPPTPATPVDLMWTEESAPTVQNATAAASLGVIELAPASEIAASLPGRRRWFRRSRTRSETKPPRHFGARWIAVTFVVGTVASLAILAAVAVGLSNTYANRVFPGVRVGSIDVSGLSRDQVIAKLKTDYAYLGQGKVTVTTPIGTDTITFAEAGRGPDLEVMADAAMSAGHTGSVIGDAAVIVRSAIRGETLPVVVQVDPMALATRIHRLVGTNAAVPKNAKVTVDAGIFAVSPSTAGSGIDEQAISGEIIDKLTRADAPTDVKSGGTFVTLGPQVTDKDAQDAIAAAQKMAVNVTLVWSPASQSASPGESPSASAGASATPSPSPTPSQSPAPTKTFAIDAQTIRSWIVFGFRTDGSYGPSLDLAPMQAYLSQLAPQMAVKAEEPWITFDATGAPAGLKNGKDGSVLDVDATSKALEAYFSGLAAGNSPASNIAVVTMAVPPSINLDSLNGFGLMGQGTWTTTFYPDISNDFGANIRTPANLLNGQVVGPGQQFSFLNAVGPIDAAHGYGMGGVIQGGHSNHTGAMGGGICSASTTMFNAAMRAGLQIDERHAHFYYITRYPVGLDATVYSNGYEVWDLKWTNDTPYPIVIRASTTRGSKSTITIQLWSLPLDRTVTLSPEFKANIIQPIDTTEYVSSLPAGQTNRAEVPTAGFDTSRTRTVTDSTGKVIHSDTWNSHYTKVDGVLQIGGSPPEPPKPTPAPGSPTPAPVPTPAPAPTPTPAPAAAPRRRQTV